MTLFVLDKSSGRAFKKNEKILSQILFRADLRVWVGRVPERVFFKVLTELKKSASKSSCVVVFVSDKRASTGVRSFTVGKAYRKRLA